MAWNKTETKDLAGQQEEKRISPGAPVAYWPGAAGKPYKDNWDIERATEEGFRKITWVFRAVTTIAGNQARLPIVLREENSPYGEVVTTNKKLLDVLNSRTNIGENSFIFRHRLSAQLLLSTRGVFIEVVRNRGGQVQSLNLLPPGITAPIPDPKTFVKSFEVEMPDGKKKYLPPQDVIWIRHPHPLDPYLSLTPLEAAGIAVEIENLARIYNRNFLMNDGRGGAMVILNGEINEDDRRELQSRHQGGPGKAGGFSVIAAEGGADYIDLGASPRDAAYVEMRGVTKEEILAAFGVPESVIGNASGRTFSNAAEEGRVFWMETMEPHLEMIARGLDDLDEKYYVGFDTSKVPILILAEQERNAYHLREWEQGTITPNEYREKTGRKKVVSELADALMVSPNLTAIGNTEIDNWQGPGQQGQQGQGGPDLSNAPLDVQTGQTPVLEFPDDVPTDGTGGQQLAERPDIPNQDDEDFVAASLSVSDLQTKGLGEDYLTKVEQDTQRWEEILGSTLDRFFERQQRVVTEKSEGKKARTALKKGQLTSEMIFNKETWNKQLEDDLCPVIKGVVLDAMNQIEPDQALDDEEITQYVKAQCEQAQKVNDTIEKEIKEGIAVASRGEDGDDDGSPLLKTAILASVLAAIYVKTRKSRREQMVEEEALTSYNAGIYFGSKRAGKTQKIWLTRGDSKVREAHLKLHGKQVAIGDGFKVQGFTLRFPKDPLAPPHLTVNCRCTLGYSTDE